MISVHFQEGHRELTSDPDRLDMNFVHSYLTRSYWSEQIPFETVCKAAENSLALGLYLNEDQIGYCRIITDYATFAYLADVFVIEEARGQGHSIWMMEKIRMIPELKGLRRWLLATRDAHRLYDKTGWKPLENPSFFMEITNPDLYKNKNQDAD